MDTGYFSLSIIGWQVGGNLVDFQMEAEVGTLITELENLSFLLLTLNFRNKIVLKGQMTSAKSR